MTPQESDIIHDIFARVRQMGPAPYDPAARAAVEAAVARDPEALLGLVRAIVALDRERQALIDEAERLRAELAAVDAHPHTNAQGGLFGDSAGPFGHPGAPDGSSRPPERREPWGSAPWGTARTDRSVPPPPPGPWTGSNPGSSDGWGRPGPQPGPLPAPGPVPAPGPWGTRTDPGPGGLPTPTPPQGSGGSVLGTVIGAATGIAGGVFAYEALKGLFGGSNHAGGGSLFGGDAHASESGGGKSGTDDFVTGGGIGGGGDDFSFFDDDLDN